MISLKESAKLVAEKKDYYKALERNGFHLPEYKSALVTRDFLIAVRGGDVYCPKYADLKIRPCPDPPASKLVHEELCNLLRHGAQQLDAQTAAPYVALVNLLRYKTTGKTWMLNVISTLSDGNHFFFSKDYVAPKRKANFQDILVTNADDFFTGLPLSKSKSNSGSMMVLSTLQREQLKLQQQEQVQIRHQQNVVKQQQRVQMLQQDQQHFNQQPVHQQQIPQQQLVPQQQPVQPPQHVPQFPIQEANNSDEDDEVPVRDTDASEERKDNQYRSFGMAARARARHAKGNVIRNQSDNEDMFR